MANFQLLIVIILWGASFVLAKMVLQYLTPAETLACRLVLALIVLKTIMLFKGVKIKWEKKDLPVLVIASIVLSIHFFIQITGLKYTSATNTGWLIAVAPVFIAVASVIFLKEKLRLLQISGIVIATIGVLFLVSEGNIFNLDWLQSTGDWLILSSGITWTIYTICSRNISRRIAPLNMIFLLLIIPTIGFVFYFCINESYQLIVNLPFNITLVLIIYGALCMGIGHWLWLEGLSKKGATGAGAFIYLEPIVTTIAAAILIDEKLAMFAAFGAILILLGVYLVEKRVNVQQQ